MDILIKIGAALTLIGIAGLIWCIVIAFKLRKSGKPDDDVKAGLQRVVALNLGALALSALGLMAVIVGVIFA